MDRKTVTAIAIVFAIIIFYQLVLIPQVSPPPQAPQAPKGQQEAKAPASATPTEPATPAPPQGKAPPKEPAELAAPALAPQVVESARETVLSETPLYSASIGNVGGRLEKLELAKYPYGRGVKDGAGLALNGKPVDLVRSSKDGGTLRLTFLDPAVDKALSTPMAVTKGKDTLSLHGAEAGGLVVYRNYSFSKDNYVIDLEVVIENRGSAPRPVSWEVAWGPGIDRHRGATDAEEEAVMVMSRGAVDTAKVKKAGDRQDFNDVSWISLGNRYFAAALIPREGTLAAFARRTAAGDLETGVHTGATILAPDQTSRHRFSVYLGPKEGGHLARAAKGLERSVDYGWFGWLALVFLDVLKFFNRFLRSYGLSIFALTLGVKLLLFPISLRMFRSMKKMQDLQPKLNALRAKYQKEPQELQRATMELYREHKVNPVAGCLPMVIQIPVFIALYRVLFNAIELRGATFLHLHDLSLKDPYYITPILMGATMIIQQRLTPSSGDKLQARMMMFMPVIFTAMFINFSSGLVLYFLYSNVLSIGEQYLFRRLSRAASPAAEGTGKGVAPPASGRKRK